MSRSRISQAVHIVKLLLVAIVTIGSAPSVFAAAQPEASPVEAKNPAEADAGDNYIPLNKQQSVLLDVAGKRVLLRTKVVLREGLLEMLLCKKQTKEHESILSIDAQAYAIHAGLTKLGAEPGAPARFVPEFVPPRGQRIDIFLQWQDRQGKLHRQPAQRWIRYNTHRMYAETFHRLPHDVKLADDSELKFDGKFKELSWYGPMSKREREKLLTLSQDKAFRQAIKNFYRQSQPRQFDTHWVFVGSSFTVNEKTGEQFYNAEGGEVICVANFPTAMIDVAIESSSQAEVVQSFEPWTERVPPIDTEVTVELVPVFEKKAENPDADD